MEPAAAEKAASPSPGTGPVSPGGERTIGLPSLLNPVQAKALKGTGPLEAHADLEQAQAPSEDDITDRSHKTLAVLAMSVLIFVMCLSMDLDASKPEASKGAAVLLVTALWWFTEAAPLTITSLFPIVLYPVLGVVPARELAAKFFGGTTFLLVAGFFIGLAVERWDLHKRMVCTIVSAMGRKVELLIAGFMLSVWMLSMWISNTAAVLCMLPVAQAFLDTLPPGHERFQSGFLLSVGYSATIGGISTPIGTPTNSIFMSQFSGFWPDAGEFSFAKFVLCALPLSALLLLTVWFGFCTFYVWRSKKPIPIDRAVFTKLNADMGKVTWEQMVVAADLLVLVILWFTAAPINSFPGWKKYVAKELDSGSTGLALTLPLFLIPCGSRLPGRIKRLIGEGRCTGKPNDCLRPRSILDWAAIRDGFKWEILFLFGGGMLIAHGTVKSQLAQWMAEQLVRVSTSELGFIFLIVLIICSITEVVSNMSTLATFGSIVASTAQAKGYDQVQLLLAVTFAASFAFMMPMAGGPNMVVYSTGKVNIRFMAANGFLLNLAGVLLGSLYIGLGMPSLLGSYKDLPPPQAL